MAAIKTRSIGHVSVAGSDRSNGRIEPETMTDRYGKRDTDTWIEASGLVVRLITDDVDDASHQRFVVRLPGGQTVLVAHNLDVSTLVPLGMGDRVRFRGLYGWNERGGLVHWTHADPMGLEPGGYIEFRTRRYS